MNFLIKKALNISIVELDKNNYPKWLINLFIKRLEGENNLHGHTLKSMHYYSKLALLYFKLINKGDSSEKLLQKVLNISKEVETRLDTLVDIEEKLLMYNHLIWLSNYQKEYEKSFKYGEKKLEVIELEFGKYNKNTSLAMNYLAGEADALGKRKRAIELYELSKDIDVKLYGENHNYCIPAYKNLTYIYEESGEYEKALNFHHKIIKIYEKEDKSSLDIAFAYNSLGYFYMKFKKYEDALMVFKKALNIYLKLSGENHHNTAVSYLNIAESYYKLENYSEAQIYAQKAYDIRVKVLDDEHEQLVAIKALLTEITKKLSTLK